MKKIYTTIFLCCNIFFLHAQWTDNSELNTLVANVNSSDIQVPAGQGTSAGESVWIAFYSQNGNNYDMRAQLMGGTSGYRLLGDNGILVSNKKSGSATYVFNTCIDTGYNLIVAFQYQKGSKMHAIIQKINQSGQLLWGDGIDLGEGLSPYPVALSTGEVAVAWNNNDVINYQKISSGGVVAWATPKVIEGNPSNKAVSRGQLIAQSNGGFSVVFQQTNTPPFYTNLYEQRFNNNGDAVWTEAVQISTLTTASYRYYDVKANKDTTYIGYYGNPSGKNRFDAYIQKVLPDGSLPWGANGSAFSDYSKDNDPSEQTINISERNYDGYVYAACTFTNVSQSESGIYFQKINANTGERLLGKKAKELFPITAEIRAITGSGIRFAPGFSLPPNVIGFTFTDVNNLLYATALEADGSFAWLNPSTVVSSTNNAKLRHGFSFTPNGIFEAGAPFIAIWQEDKGDGDKPYAQDVNSGNGALGDLPVTLINFKASKVNSNIQLQWQTATEINNKGFYIQRSFDGIHFSNIGFAASKAVGGNSTLTLNYTFTDNKPGSKNYYRLQQTDKDGKTSYSSIVQMNIASSETVQLFPNPVKDKLSISISSWLQNFTVVITDAKGMQVAKKNFENVNGTTELDVHAFVPGIYFVKIMDEKNADIIATGKFDKD